MINKKIPGASRGSSEKNQTKGNQFKAKLLSKLTSLPL